MSCMRKDFNCLYVSVLRNNRRCTFFFFQNKFSMNCVDFPVLLLQMPCEYLSLDIMERWIICKCFHGDEVMSMAWRKSAAYALICQSCTKLCMYFAISVRCQNKWHLSTHWGLVNMAHMGQMTFSNVFYWMKNCIQIKDILKFVPVGPVNDRSALV